MRVSLLTAGHGGERGVDSSHAQGTRIGDATGAALLALAPAAQADHHFVSITEVFPGVSENPAAEFVELQMYSAGQNNFEPGASLSFHNAAGAVDRDASSGRTSRNGANQRTLLIGTPAMETLFGKQADTEYASAALDRCGRRGVPALERLRASPLIVWLGVRRRSPAPERLSTRSPMARRSCATSALAATRCSNRATTRTRASTTSQPAPSSTPQPNTEAGPTESCPNTKITKKPKAKTKDRTPSSSSRAATASCAASTARRPRQCDSGQFEPGKLSRGKHEFAVRATEADGSVTAPPPSTPGRSSRGA